MIYVAVSDNLKVVRVQKNLTQKELGELMHVSDKTISTWESGRSLPDIETIKKLAGVLKVRYEILVDGETANQIRLSNAKKFILGDEFMFVSQIIVIGILALASLLIKENEILSISLLMISLIVLVTSIKGDLKISTRSVNVFVKTSIFIPLFTLNIFKLTMFLRNGIYTGHTGEYLFIGIVISTIVNFIIVKTYKLNVKLENVLKSTLPILLMGFAISVFTYINYYPSSFNDNYYPIISSSLILILLGILSVIMDFNGVRENKLHIYVLSLLSMLVLFETILTIIGVGLGNVSISYRYREVPIILMITLCIYQIYINIKRKVAFGRNIDIIYVLIFSTIYFLIITLLPDKLNNAIFHSGSIEMMTIKTSISQLYTILYALWIMYIVSRKQYFI